MNTIEQILNLQTSEKIQFIFIIFAFVFMIFSFLGWVLELFFRRFVSQKKWVNPGFLRGPYLPIYGIGVLTLTIYIFLLLLLEEFFPNKILFDIVVVLGIGILMTLIELIAGLIFIKGMNIRLWDYSNRKVNFQGIICLEFSLIWTFLGGVFYFLLFTPIVNMVVTFLSLDWFKIAIFLMGMFYGIFILDLVYSLNIANKIKKFAKENHIVLKLEKLKLHIQEKVGSKNFKFLAPFKSSIPLIDHLKSFINEQKDKIEKRESKKKKDHKDISNEDKRK